MLELLRLTGDHLEAVLAFELENRAYFARSVTDRGDEFYKTFAERHRALLDEQDAGIYVFFVLVDRDGSIVGRFNLYDLENGAAEVGYRVAERVAGRGVATEALSNLCRKAADHHGLRTLTAGTSTANVASQRVLEKARFASTGTCVVGGKPCLKFTLSLAASSPRGPRFWNHERSGVSPGWFDAALPSASGRRSGSRQLSPVTATIGQSVECLRSRSSRAAWAGRRCPCIARG